MTHSSFDAYKDSYQREIESSIAFSGRGLDFFTRVKAERLVKLARRWLGEPSRLRVLDIGCGVGLTDKYVANHFGGLWGVDISPGCLESAARQNPSVNYHLTDGESLPFADATFDLAFTICVLHHVPPPRWGGFINQMRRVVRPGGLSVIMEHNPLNPLTRMVVSRCVFDADAVLLSRRKAVGLFHAAGFEVLDRSSFLLFPWRGQIFQSVERLLGTLPVGAQYNVVGRRPLAGEEVGRQRRAA